MCPAQQSFESEDHSRHLAWLSFCTASDLTSFYLAHCQKRWESLQPCSAPLGVPPSLVSSIPSDIDAGKRRSISLPLIIKHAPKPLPAGGGGGGGGGGRGDHDLQAHPPVSHRPGGSGCSGYKISAIQMMLFRCIRLVCMPVTLGNSRPLSESTSQVLALACRELAPPQSKGSFPPSSPRCPICQVRTAQGQYTIPSAIVYHSRSATVALGMPGIGFQSELATGLMFSLRCFCFWMSGLLCPVPHAHWFTNHKSRELLERIVTFIVPPVSRIFCSSSVRKLPLLPSVLDWARPARLLYLRPGQQVHLLSSVRAVAVQQRWHFRFPHNSCVPFCSQHVMPFGTVTRVRIQVWSLRRKHLKNNENNVPAKDADELWSMMRGAATALGSGIGTSLTGEPDNNEPAKRPGTDQSPFSHTFSRWHAVQSPNPPLYHQPFFGQDDVAVTGTKRQRWTSAMARFNHLTRIVLPLHY